MCFTRAIFAVLFQNHYRTRDVVLSLGDIMSPGNIIHRQPNSFHFNTPAACERWLSKYRDLVTPSPSVHILQLTCFLTCEIRLGKPWSVGILRWARRCGRVCSDTLCGGTTRLSESFEMRPIGRFFFMFASDKICASYSSSFVWEEMLQ